MSLIDMFLSRAVKRGRLTLLRPGAQPATFGTPEPGFPEVTIRFADRRVAMAIARNPALGAGECFMHGRLIVEQGDIRDLVNLLTANDKWESGQDNLDPSLVRARRRGGEAPPRPHQHGAPFEEERRASLRFVGPALRSVSRPRQAI